MRRMARLALDRYVVRVHLLGTVNAVKAALPAMVERRYGRIVFATSVSGCSGISVVGQFQILTTCALGVKCASANPKSDILHSWTPARSVIPAPTEVGLRTRTRLRFGTGISEVAVRTSARSRLRGNPIQDWGQVPGHCGGLKEAASCEFHAPLYDLKQSLPPCASQCSFCARTHCASARSDPDC